MRLFSWLSEMASPSKAGQSKATPEKEYNAWGWDPFYHLEPRKKQGKRRTVEYKEDQPPSRWDNKCELCDKEFVNKAKRDRHVEEVHVLRAAAAIKCPVCDMSFSRKEHMLRHRQIHDGNLPSISCEICEETFTQFGNLMRHKRLVHSGKKLECPACPATYARKDKLDAHINSGNHYITFFCKICNQNIVFKKLAGVEDHVRFKPLKGGMNISCKSSKNLLNIKGGKNVQDRFIAEGIEKAKKKLSTVSTQTD